MKYVDVIVPLHIPHPLTYLVLPDDEDRIGLGSIVLVPVGKGQQYPALVVELFDKAPHEGIKYKSVTILDIYPRVPTSVLKVWNWISSYYMCSMGDVWKAVAPAFLELEQNSALKPKRSKTLVHINEKFSKDNHNHHVNWERFVEKLRRRKQLLRVAAALRENENNTSRTRQYLINKYHTSSATIKNLIDLSFLEEVSTTSQENDVEVPKSKFEMAQEEWGKLYLIEAFAETPLLVEGAFKYHYPYQSIPFDWVRVRLMEQKNVLILYPTQDILDHAWPYLLAMFKDDVSRYTSEDSVAYRQRVWLSALNDRGKIFVGQRSATLLPIQNLGGVIVYGEEDAWYKQTEPAPRYHAANVALVLGKVYRCQVLLCSASPSIEMYTHAKRNIYKSVIWEDKSRSQTIPVDIVDLEAAIEKGQIRGRLLSFELQQAIAKAMHQSKNVLLFYHRQGYAKSVQCLRCGDTILCPICDIPLKKYNKSGSLACPICGYYKEQPDICPSCGQGQLKVVGTGIDRLFDEVQELFPDSIVAKSDSDSILFDEADIVISSESKTNLKLLKEAHLMAFLNIDILFYRHDYRANERVHQMLCNYYLAAESLEKMFIQTFSSSHLALVLDNKKVEARYRNNEIIERHKVKFPPFSKLISIVIEDQKREQALFISRKILDELTKNLRNCIILGPGPIPVKKARADVGFKLWIKIPLKLNMKEVKETIKITENRVLLKYKPSRSLKIYYDVDPVW